MKWATKGKFSNLLLIDNSKIFTQICPKLASYTKWVKIKSILQTSALQIPEMEICESNQPFCNFTQINPKLSSISKWEKLKLAKWAKLKSIL